MQRFLPGLLALSVLSGCGEPVREDRAADWGRDGATVAFQHEKEGVFVADKHGKTLTKIFEPDASVLATSRPLFSPDDGRLIFTTAQDLTPEAPAQNSPPNAPVIPEGNLVWERPVKYTCWLRAATEGDQPASPKALFTARCQHLGYIAAALSVRWHPDGTRVLFIDSTPNSNAQHGVYEFDLKTETTRCVFPHRADALIFDFTPLGTYLVCVSGAAPQGTGGGPSPSATGIWIGNPDDGKSWWQVPNSARTAVGELPSLIESLRASRPAWTANDSTFAGVVSGPAPVAGQPCKSLLQVTNAITRRPHTIYESDGQLADLNWSPDGTRIGFVERKSQKESALLIYDEPTGISEPVNAGAVRKFAGFDRTGEHFAYIVPDDTGLPDPSQQWPLLLVPDPLARDKVLIADVDQTASPVEVFSGMRVTFPVWSPTEDRLSVWVTFVPRYRSLLSLLRRWGLLPGDPAATLDLATREISWLAVNPGEELQVGHYYLLKKDYARAWERYERANRKLPPRDFQAFTQSLGSAEQSQVFEYLCLDQLGRRDEARARLQEFERSFFPVDPGAPAGAAGSINDLGPTVAAEALRQLGAESPLLMRLIHDLYIAEVFLSVDAADAGIALLREQLAANDTGPTRLSRQIALAQLLLIAGRYDEYLALCPAFLKPLESAMPEQPANGNGGETAGLNSTLRTYGSLICLAPLFRREFVANFSHDSLSAAIERWDGMRTGTGHFADATIDLFLRAAHQALGNAERVQAIEGRLARNAAFKNNFGDKPIDEAMRDLFAIPGAIGQLVPPH